MSVWLVDDSDSVIPGDCVPVSLVVGVCCVVSAGSCPPKYNAAPPTATTRAKHPATIFAAIPVVTAPVTVAPVVAAVVVATVAVVITPDAQAAAAPVFAWLSAAVRLDLCPPVGADIRKRGVL